MTLYDLAGAPILAGIKATLAQAKGGEDFCAVAPPGWGVVEHDRQNLTRGEQGKGVARIDGEFDLGDKSTWQTGQRTLRLGVPTEQAQQEVGNKREMDERLGDPQAQGRQIVHIPRAGSQGSG